MAGKPRSISIEKAKKLAELYNTARQNWHPSHEFTMDEICSVFKNVGFPSNITYVSKYPAYGLIIRQSRGKYRFPAEPVHFNMIIKCIEAVRRDNRNRRPAKTNPKVVQKQDTARQPKIEECIAFLKERGYLILKIC